MYLKAVSLVDDGYDSVMLVGHNPTITDFANENGEREYRQYSHLRPRRTLAAHRPLARDQTRKSPPWSCSIFPKKRMGITFDQRRKRMGVTFDQRPPWIARPRPSLISRGQGWRAPEPDSARRPSDGRKAAQRIAPEDLPQDRPRAGGHPRNRRASNKSWQREVSRRGCKIGRCRLLLRWLGAACG